MFIVSLATADLTVGLVVMPISTVYVFSTDWPFGLVVCQFWLAVDYTASTASILNLLVLSIDRYRSVTAPLRHLRRRTSAYASVLIVAAWSLSALWVLPIVAWHWMFTHGQRFVPPGMTLDLFATTASVKIMCKYQTRSHPEFLGDKGILGRRTNSGALNLQDLKMADQKRTTKPEKAGLENDGPGYMKATIRVNKKLSYRRETARQLRIHAQLTRCFSAVAV